MGQTAANKTHRYFINMVLLFMAYNVYYFVTSYNSYWRLRRDDNIPMQWLAEEEEEGHEDWQIERKRQEREQRLSRSDA